MKAPGLVAAAGVAAALGFYSANYDRLSANPANLETFNDILFWLFASLLFTVSAPGFAYLSQLGYLSSIYAQSWHFDPPFTRSTLASRRYKIAGDVCRWTTVVLVVLSVLCLIRGGYEFLQIAR